MYLCSLHFCSYLCLYLSFLLMKLLYFEGKKKRVNLLNYSSEKWGVCLLLYKPTPNDYMNLISFPKARIEPFVRWFTKWVYTFYIHLANEMTSNGNLVPTFTEHWSHWVLLCPYFYWTLVTLDEHTTTLCFLISYTLYVCPYLNYSQNRQVKTRSTNHFKAHYRDQANDIEASF